MNEKATHIPNAGPGSTGFRHEEEHIRLASIVEFSDDAIIGKTLEGVIVSWNRGAQRIYGYSEEEVVGRSISLLVPPDRPDELREILETIKRGDLVDHFETVRIRKDGGLIDISLTVSPLKNSAGDIIGASTIARDITRRKRAEEEQQRLAEENATISEIGRIISSSLDIGEVYEGFAKEMNKLVDFDRISIDTIDHERGLAVVKYIYGEEAQGYNPGITFPWQGDRVQELSSGNILITEDADPVSTSLDFLSGFRSDALVPLISRGHIIGIMVLRSRRAGAYGPQERVILESLANLIGPAVDNGSLYEEAVLAEQELARQAQELSRSNTELEQFAYVASHDLQEPLRMVSSYVQLLSRRYKDKLDSDADDFIGFAVDGAARMQVLINDLLTYSRVGTQGRPFEPTDCNNIIRRVIDDLTGIIGDAGATVVYDDLPTINCDATQLGQLFQNLVANALKFRSEDPPRVHISSNLYGEGKDNDWVFSVRDNGIGIAPDYFEQIFLIFQRLHNRSEYAGTGIGLAVCKKIVERHGGRIWVDSEHGKGSTFHFTLSPG
jgi:PAS domain S-box-containing protein